MDKETEKQALEAYEQHYDPQLRTVVSRLAWLRCWALAQEASGRASGQQGAPSDDAVDVAAKAMWNSEPVVFAWGPPERRHASWEEAVERNLAGVEIFRQFARAMLSALAASPQITTPAAQDGNNSSPMEARSNGAGQEERKNDLVGTVALFSD